MPRLVVAAHLTQSPAFVRAAAGLAFVGAALLTVIGSIERWWPICRPESLDTTQCGQQVAHLYDELPPLWIFDSSLSGAAYNTGAALFTALGLVLIAVLAEPARRPTAYLLGGIALVGYPLGILWGTTSSATVIDLGLAMLAYWSWMLAAPFLLVTTWRAHLPGNWASSDHVMYVALICATPLLAILIGRLLVSGSGLAPVPWSELAGGALLLVAGFSCLAGLRTIGPDRRSRYSSKSTISEETR